MVKRLQTVSGFLLISVCAMAQPKEVKPGFNLFSKDQDVQLGREAAAQIERQVQVVRDNQLNSYINEIGRRLASTPEAGGYPYTFKVVNDNSINAFALPGGPTYVNTGLIRAAENEAQLAGVMAHEIAHVALRHGTNQASKANLLQLPAMLAGAVMGNGSMMGQLAQLGIGLGFNSVLLKFSRSAETDADILGARMLAKAGYNPIEMARFFEKLESQGGSRGPQFLSSHPNPGNRMRTIQEEIRYIPQRNFNGGTGDFREIQARIGGLPPAEQSRARIQESPSGDPRPSGGMRTFQGREFSIAYPDNWEAFGDQQSAMITLAPRAGLVQDNSGNIAVAYGAMVSFYFPQRGGRVDLRDATDDLIVQLRQSNPTMQARSGRQRRTRINGQNALVTTLYSQSPLRGENEIDMLVTIERPEGIFYAVFIAPEREYSALQSTFDRMLQSVRFR